VKLEREEYWPVISSSILDLFLRILEELVICQLSLTDFDLDLQFSKEL